MFGEDGEDPEKSVMRGEVSFYGSRLQTELVEGEMVKWVKGRLHRGLVLRCAKSIIQIWVNLRLFFSFHWRPYDMWVSEEVWEECGRKRWDFLYLNFASFHHVVCRSCLLSGIGRGTEAELGPDKPEFVCQQRWWYRGSGLVFGEDGEDPEEPVMRGEVRKYGSR